MKTFIKRFATRVLAGASVCVLAAGVTISTPTAAKADAWAAGAVGAIMLGIIAGARKPAPTHTVIARYCKSHATGLYHKC